MPRLLTRSQARLGGTALAVMRAAIGVVAWITPRLVLRPWIGDAPAADPGTKLIGRALGGRDIAIAAGALLAERHDTRTRGWIEAGMLADAGDLAATLINWKNVPARTRYGMLALIGGAVAAGLVIAPCIDDGD